MFEREREREREVTCRNLQLPQGYVLYKFNEGQAAADSCTNHT